VLLAGKPTRFAPKKSAYGQSVVRRKKTAPKEGMGDKFPLMYAGEADTTMQGKKRGSGVGK